MNIKTAALYNVVIIALVICVIQMSLSLLIISKPDNEKCMQATATHEHGQFVASIGEYANVTQYAYRVEDHLFYKTIYSRITGKRVAIAAAGKIWF